MSTPHMGNVYSDWHRPEDFNMVAAVDITLESYEFDMAMIVEHNGELRWFTDAGCSCPSPFEYQSWDEGNPNMDELWAYLEERIGEERKWSYSRLALTTADITDLKRKVAQL